LTSKLKERIETLEERAKQRAAAPQRIEPLASFDLPKHE